MASDSALHVVIIVYEAALVLGLPVATTRTQRLLERLAVALTHDVVEEWINCRTDEIQNTYNCKQISTKLTHLYHSLEVCNNY